MTILFLFCHYGVWSVDRCEQKTKLNQFNIRHSGYIYIYYYYFSIKFKKLVDMTHLIGTEFAEGFMD